MPFAFYYQLTQRQQRDYRKSDEVENLPLPQDARLRIWERVDALEAALGTGKLNHLQVATAEFASAVTQAFDVGPARIQVKSRRPRNRSGDEYYGLTTWEEGKQPLIELWMLTRAHRRVVAFKTYMRTLIHELLHHLDYSYLGLRDSFHTQGFFKRESSLFRQLVIERPSRIVISKNMNEPRPNQDKQRSAEKKREAAPASRNRRMEPNAGTAPPGSSGRRGKRRIDEQLILPLPGPSARRT